MTIDDELLARLGQAVTRLEQALESPERIKETARDRAAGDRKLAIELKDAVARNRKLESRLADVGGRLDSVIVDLKSVLER